MSRRVSSPLVSGLGFDVATIGRQGSKKNENFLESLKIMLPSVTMTETRDADRTIPTRRISFEASLRDMPKHFAADGDLILSHLAAALSAVFPDGEDFFVRSVRHYRDRITDPELKRQVAGFIGQESVHGREHRVLNDRLAELGYPTKQAEWLTRKGLALRWKFAPKKASLAMT